MKRITQTRTEKEKKRSKKQKKKNIHRQSSLSTGWKQTKQKQTIQKGIKKV